MSMFIHSMEEHFPGSLEPDVRTNPVEWDKIGKNLDHSTTFGEMGDKFVKNVNKNYSDHPSSANGKRYRAAQIKDTSLSNLEAWAEDCNISILIYDGPNFGHWADINSVDPSKNRLNLQDYSKRYDVGYNSANNDVDFSVFGSAGSAMGSNFDESDPIAGDTLFGFPLGESVYFYVVCEAEKTDGTWGMPKKNSKGKTLNR